MTPAQAALRERVDLLERANYACEACDAKDVELQVHHRYYNSQAYHGDYPPESLEVLCTSCHLKADKLRRRLCKAIGKMGEGIAMRALGYMEGLVLEDEWGHPSTTIEIRSFEHAQGIAEVFAIDPKVLIDLCNREYKVTLGALILASPRRHYQQTQDLLKKGL